MLHVTNRALQSNTRLSGPQIGQDVIADQKESSPAEIRAQLQRHAKESFTDPRFIADSLVTLLKLGECRADDLECFLSSTHLHKFDQILDELAVQIANADFVACGQLPKALSDLFSQIHDSALALRRFWASPEDERIEATKKLLKFFHHVGFTVPSQHVINALTQLETIGEYRRFGAYLDHVGVTFEVNKLERPRARCWVATHNILREEIPGPATEEKWLIATHLLVQPEPATWEVIVATLRQSTTQVATKLIKNATDETLEQMILCAPYYSDDGWIPGEISFSAPLTMYSEVFSRIQKREDPAGFQNLFERSFNQAAEQDALDLASRRAEATSPFRSAVFYFLLDHFSEELSLKITECIFAARNGCEAEMATHLIEAIRTISHLASIDKEIPSVLADKCGIRMFGRYTSDQLCQQYRLLKTPVLVASLPVHPIFILTGTHDHNFALGHVLSGFPAGVDVFITEAESSRGFVAAVTAFTDLFGPIQAGGSFSHGSCDSFIYGDEADCFTRYRLLNPGSSSLRDLVRRSFAEFADFILYACESGARKGMQEAFVEVLSGKQVRTFGCIGQNHFISTRVETRDGRYFLYPHFDVAAEEPFIEDVTREMIS
ncbi:MAG: hypothetical protein RIS36_627 [Pseudomonadota bacterium]